MWPCVEGFLFEVHRFSSQVSINTYPKNKNIVFLKNISDDCFQPSCLQEALFAYFMSKYFVFVFNDIFNCFILKKHPLMLPFGWKKLVAIDIKYSHMVSIYKFDFIAV